MPKDSRLLSHDYRTQNVPDLLCRRNAGIRLASSSAFPIPSLPFVTGPSIARHSAQSPQCREPPSTVSHQTRLAAALPFVNVLLYIPTLLLLSRLLRLWLWFVKRRVRLGILRVEGMTRVGSTRFEETDSCGVEEVVVLGRAGMRFMQRMSQGMAERSEREL